MLMCEISLICAHCFVKRMKMRNLVISSIIVFVAGFANAKTINVISQQYHVWGSYNYKDSAGQQYSDSYDITDVTPVNGSVLYSASLYGSSSAGLLSISADSDAVNGHLGGTANSYAEGDWVFSPQAGYDTLELEFSLYSGYDYDTVRVQLEDITAGSQMYNCNDILFNFNYPDVHTAKPSTEVFSLDPDHQYHLHVYTASTADYDGIWSQSVVATLAPEPQAILILALGVILLDRRKS